MVTKLDQWRESSARRRRRAERGNYRLDIQGLRAVAVLAVVAHHLTGWPRGGFTGVDVFLVMAGFFAADSLLRKSAELRASGVGQFYAERLRRIVPLATVVLVLTVVASAFVLPDAVRDIGVDAVFAFFFVANWRFAADGAEPLGATTDSPLLHYWPLSIEEQFFLVWPLLVLAITLIAARRAWTHTRRLTATTSVLAVIAAGSFAWACVQTLSSPAAAYFDTFARVWELAAGALLATAAARLSRIPDLLRPVVSWAGLTLVAAGLVFVDGAAGFPAPWALIPVLGAMLVIASGVGREPDYQGLLRNPVATYLGDISYSLYLVHWPVIVLLAVVMQPDVHYLVCALTVTLGLSIALHHFVDAPLRGASADAVRQAREEMRHGLYEVGLSTKLAGAAAVALLTAGVISYAMSPDAVSSGPEPASISPAAPAS